MKKFKKIFISFALIICSLFFVACGPASANVDSELDSKVQVNTSGQYSTSNKVELQSYTANLNSSESEEESTEENSGFKMTISMDKLLGMTVNMEITAVVLFDEESNMSSYALKMTMQIPDENDPTITLPMECKVYLKNDKVYCYASMLGQVEKQYFENSDFTSSSMNYSNYLNEYDLTSILDNLQEYIDEEGVLITKSEGENGEVKFKVVYEYTPSIIDNVEDENEEYNENEYSQNLFGEGELNEEEDEESLSTTIHNEIVFVFKDGEFVGCESTTSTTGILGCTIKASLVPFSGKIVYPDFTDYVQGTIEEE